jgi:hypothetical protein
MRRVKAEDVQGVGHLVLHALTLGLRRAPQFEVVDTVIRSIAVFVVYFFVSKQCTPKMGLHRTPMPEDLPAPISGANLKRKPNGEGSISSDGYVVFQA